MKRLYFLSKNLDQVERISKHIHAMGVTDWHFHVISNDEAGLTTHKIHSANPFDRYDLFRSGERGAIYGLMAGIVAVLLMNNFTEIFLTFGVGLALIIIIPATLLGTWTGGMVGINHEHYQLAQFHDQINDGQHLIMIDVANDQADILSAFLKREFSIDCERQRLIHHLPFSHILSH